MSALHEVSGPGDAPPPGFISLQRSHFLRLLRRWKASRQEQTRRNVAFLAFKRFVLKEEMICSLKITLKRRCFRLLPFMLAASVANGPEGLFLPADEPKKNLNLGYSTRSDQQGHYGIPRRLSLIHHHGNRGEVSAAAAAVVSADTCSSRQTLPARGFVREKNLVLEFCLQKKQLEAVAMGNDYGDLCHV